MHSLTTVQPKQHILLQNDLLHNSKSVISISLFVAISSANAINAQQPNPNNVAVRYMYPLQFSFMSLDAWQYDIQGQKNVNRHVHGLPRLDIMCYKYSVSKMYEKMHVIISIDQIVL